MLDIECLRAFVAVLDTQSFSQAAERLHLSQPAISKRIAVLESQLDCRIFDRINRTVVLTEAGRALNQRARHILLALDETELAVRNLQQETSGQLQLGTSHHIGLWRLPGVLRTYVDQYPQVSLDLHFMDSEVAHEQVSDGSLELALVTLAPQGYDDVSLSAIPVWNDPLAFACSPDHKLAGLTELPLGRLAEYPAILPDQSTYTGRIVRQLFEQHKLQLSANTTTNYLETLKMLVSIGLGWSVLPASMLDDTTVAIAVDGLAVQRQLGFIHDRRRTLSGAARAFIDLAH